MPKMNREKINEALQVSCLGCGSLMELDHGTNRDRLARFRCKKCGNVSTKFRGLVGKIKG